MVLASNEWLKNCDDGQKSATANTTGTSNTAIGNNTAVTTAAANSITPNSNHQTNISTLPPPQTTPTAARIATDNANYEQIGRNPQQQQPQQQLQQPPQELQQRRTQVVLPIVNININKLKAMAETARNENAKNDSRNLIDIASDIDCNASENNNLDSQGGSLINISSVSDISNSTLKCQLPTGGQQAIMAQAVAAAQSVSNPITQQALSNALQSALNVSNTMTTGAADTHLVEKNFLHFLGNCVSGGVENMNLQQTAKQLNSAFCSMEAQSNLDNNTAAIININSSNLDNTNAVDLSGQAKIVLLCDANSHPFQMRSILLTPNIECKVGRLIAKSKVTDCNAIFDCKVLSRNHAVLWYTDDGKFWVKDTKSSNGTFINENKLDTEAAELHFGDIVKFGVDVLENSRKEMHGCIVACVKLYLPDGREAFTIDNSQRLSAHSGDSRISYDELHRLNMYLQEATQREKLLKSKLFNIQNILDATRKNSASCWQSMIAEDQLLHRINSLEKKLQVMEKNVPDNVLRNEVLKLLDDKNLYQHTAKEALRKVYQERCEAMQMLSKLEGDFTASDNECKILRDQIMNTKQSLQDVNGRLLQLETEYNTYREEIERRLLEAKDKEEQRTTEMTHKLSRSELECEELRHKITELLLKRRTELCDEDEQQLQQQAIEKLDAAIADMDLGDDEDDDNADVADYEKTNLNDSNELAKRISGGMLKETSNSISLTHSEQPPKQSTILKWLKNSDLNEKDGSMDIFNAICNDSDSSDDQQTTSFGEDTGAGTIAVKSKFGPVNFDKKWNNFTDKLQCVQTNLMELEEEMSHEQTEVKVAAITTPARIGKDNIDVIDEAEEDKDGVNNDELALKNKVKSTSSGGILSDQKSFKQLKSSIDLLYAAYNEVRESLKDPLHCQLATAKLPSLATKPITPLPASSVQTQFQNYAQHKHSNSAAKKLETVETLKPLLEANEENDSDEDGEGDGDGGGDDDDLSEATTRCSMSSVHTVRDIEGGAQNVKKEGEQQQLELEIQGYQREIASLNAKVEQIESDTNNTLEIMQIECDQFKQKVGEMTTLIATLHEEKKALEQVITENKSNTMKSAESLEIREPLPPYRETSQLIVDELRRDDETKKEKHIQEPGVEAIISTSSQQFNQQMSEELEAINSINVQREEELIMYKERLEQTLNDNVQLRQEITELKKKANKHMNTLLRQTLPLGAAVVALIVYFIATYF